MGTRIALVVGSAILVLALVLDFGYTSTDVKIRDSKEDTLSAALDRNRELSERRATTSSEFIPDESAQPDTAPPLKRVEFSKFEQGPDLSLQVTTELRHPWLDPSNAVDAILEQAATSGRDDVYAWIQVAPASDREQLKVEWQDYDVDVISFSGEFARVRLPNSKTQLEALAEHPGVKGLGIQPDAAKISPSLASQMSNLTSAELPVLITLMETDHNGTWRTDLEANGAVVGEWLPYMRAYSANIPTNSITTIASADYVTSIEPIEIFQVLLDTAVPTMGVDVVRTFDETRGTFTGTTGAAIPIGLVDTGLNINHADIASNRTSICGGNFYPDSDGDGEADLWSDFRGHGTHVTGIIAGSGTAQPELAGMAPAVQHIRMAKVLDRDGTGTSVTVANGVRYLLRETGCEWRGVQSEAIRPLLLNMSLGGPGDRDGRGASNRNIDAVITHGSQLLVLAAGNDGTNGTSNEATAKNVLAVGAVTDAGLITGFSSHGPTADERLNPHVVGTGSAIVSARGNSASRTYQRFNGTSMAAPSVAGVATLLMDLNPEFRNAPAYAKARLMASAVKPSQTLGQDAFPLTNSDGPGAFNAEYGLGLVSANVAIQDSSEGKWSHGGDHGWIESGESYRYDIEVAEGTARLDIVLTWIESPNVVVAPATVAANLDLYLDRGDDCGEVACGEYASTSLIDNVEWIVVKDPEPGAYVLKIAAGNDFADSVHAGIAWTAIAGTDAPALTVSADETALTIESGSGFEIDLNVSADDFLAAGTTLHMVCRSESATGCDSYEGAHWLPSSHVLRDDATRIVIDTPVEVAIPLGEVRVGDARSVSLAVPRGVATETHSLYFIASSWNAASSTTEVKVLPGGGDSVVQATRPSNDAMTSATVLADESGETTLDLLLATREPGEPILQSERGGGGVKKFYGDGGPNQANFDQEMQSYARHGSVWFSIDAANSGPYRLGVLPRLMSEGTRIAVYEGSTATESNRLSVQEGVAEFQATSGNSYLVQVWTDLTERNSLRLSWNQFDDLPPVNDDFENRTTLSGERGVVAGTNYRATLESFEFYGIRAVGATTWFRWVAPDSARYEFEVSDGLRAFVFDGTNTGSLRRVSTMPLSSYDDSQFEAEQNREYHIAVLDSADRLVPEYELTWRPVNSAFGYASNDMIRNAETIEGASGEESISSFRSSTVEPNEDVKTGVGTTWWRWNPPMAGNYVMRLNGAGGGKLAAFSGTSPDDLAFVTDGNTLRLNAAEDQQYWISLGYRNESMFADVDDNALALSFSWGPLPENDLFSSPQLLSGMSGTITADHSFATSERGEFAHIRGHSSLWWDWVAPKTGWQRFELQDWEAAGLDEETQQGILAIYHQPSGSRPTLIATSDHSYIANGRAEAVIRAEADEQYLVRVALRSTGLGDWTRELTFSYEPAEVPAWQRYAGRVVEVGGIAGELEDADLFRPRSIALIGDSGQLVVATHEGLVTYTEDGDGTLSQLAKAPYRNAAGDTLEIQEGALLHWDSNAERLYLLQEEGFFEVSTPVTEASQLTRCAPENPIGVIPEQISIDSNSENMYVFGEEEINVYAITQACEFEPLQIVASRTRFGTNTPFTRLTEFRGAHTITLSSDDAYIYTAGRDGLVTLSRSDEGTLSHETTLSIIRWFIGRQSLERPYEFREASVVLGSDDVLFVVATRSPVIAAFSLSRQSSGEDPTLLDAVEDFYISDSGFYRYPFYSHIERPLRNDGCTPISAYSEESPTVNVFCNGQVFTVRWDETEESLFISDWFQLEQTDRFGHQLRDGLSALSPGRILVNTQGNRNYVLGKGTIGTLHIFDRASRITENPYTQ